MHLIIYYTQKTKENNKTLQYYLCIYLQILSLYCHSTYNILLLFIQLYAFIYVLLYIQKTKTTQKQNKQHTKKLYNTIYAFIHWK